jgi:hypothetical protein
MVAFMSPLLSNGHSCIGLKMINSSRQMQTGTSWMLIGQTKSQNSTTFGGKTASLMSLQDCREIGTIK